MKEISYADVTLRQYLYIQDALTDEDLTDEQKTAEYIRILFDKEMNDIPIFELNEYLASLSFLSKPFDRKPIQKQYTLNGHVYVLTNKIEKLTAAQYLDFVNYSQAENKEYEKMISCFLIPYGHKYNDGYEQEDVWNDVLDHMDMITLNSLSFFFLKQLMRYTNHIVGSLMWEVIKMKGVTMKQKRLLLKEMYLGMSNMERLIS